MYRAFLPTKGKKVEIYEGRAWSLILQANCTMDNTLKLKMCSCHNNFGIFNQ